MATDRRVPVREVDPSQRHLAVESIGAPAAGSPDTAGTPPALTTIRLGASLAGAAGLAGIIEAIENKDR